MPRAGGGLAVIRALALVALVEGVAFAKPAPLHTAAIPDGDRWVCFVWDKGMRRASGCERSQELCEHALADAVMASQDEISSDDIKGRCVDQPSAWVATAQRKSGAWTRIAAPTAAACAARAKRDFAALRAASACAEVAGTAPGAPDPSLIPTGKGWWCYQVHNAIDPGAFASACFRRNLDCIHDHPMHEMVADPTRLCHKQATAWLYTDGDRAHVYVEAAECDGERLLASDRSGCAELK